MASKGTSSTPEIKINFSYEDAKTAKGRLNGRLTEIQKAIKPVMANIEFKANKDTITNLNKVLGSVKTKLNTLTLDTLNKNLTEALGNATKLAEQMARINKTPYARKIIAPNISDKVEKQANKEQEKANRELEKSAKAQENFDIMKTKLQGVLNLLSQSKTISNQVIADMQKNLDNLNMSNTKKEIDAFKSSLSTLGKNDSNITQMNKKFDDTINKIAQLRGKAIEINDTKALAQLEKIEKEMNDVSVASTLMSNGMSINMNGVSPEFDKIANSVDKVGKQIKSTTDAQEKLNKEMNQKAKDQTSTNLTQMDLYRKLDLVSQSGNIATEVIAKFRKEVDNIATASPESLAKLDQDIKTLISNDKGIAGLSKKFNTLEKDIADLRTLAIKLNDQEALKQLDKLQKEMEEAKKVSVDMANGLAISSTSSGQGVEKLSNSVKSLKKNLTDAEKAQDRLNKQSSAFGSTMRDFGQLFGMYSLAYTGVRMLTTGIREGFSAVKEMDKTLTTLSITLDGITNSKLKTFGADLQNLSRDLSTTTSRVLETSQVFANLSETLDSIKNKTKSAVILGNISGAGVEESVNAIQGATQQFRDLGDGTEESSMKVTDSMTAISKSLAIDFGAGVRGFIDGVSVMGGVSDQLGMDIDDTLGLLGTGMEKLRLTGLIGSV